MSETAKRLKELGVVIPKPPAPADNYGPFVRLGGFFNVASSFDGLPQATNGASDLVADLFGAKGRHARSTVGVSHVPLNALAIVEAVFEIKP
jgi:hypothetical protein